MQNKIILYDIPSNLTPKAWSPNVWKARFILNYKGLPYETVWVSYPDIGALWERLGLAPDVDKKTGKPYMYLPIISVPSENGGPPSVIAESFNIALFLDHEFPDTPRVIPPNTAALQASFVRTMRNSLIPSLGPLLVSQVPSKLDEWGSIYFTQTRKESWKVQDLADVAPRGSETRTQHVQALKEGFQALYELLMTNGGLNEGAEEEDENENENDEVLSPSSPGNRRIRRRGSVRVGRTGGRHWVMGPIGPTFADFALGGILYWIQSVEDPADENEQLGKRGTGELWNMIRLWNGGRWARFMDSLSPWMASE